MRFEAVYWITCNTTFRPWIPSVCYSVTKCKFYDVQPRSCRRQGSGHQHHLVTFSGSERSLLFDQWNFPKIVIFTTWCVCRLQTMQWQDVHCPSVCLSVCHMPVFCWNGYTYPGTFFTIGWPHHSSFFIPNASQHSDGNAIGYEKNAIFDQYLAFSWKWYNIEP